MSLLDITNLEVGYGGVAAVRGISLSVDSGSALALLGANGAGKSSTLRAISGLVEPRAGSIHFEGHDLAGMSPESITRLGIAHVPEGRGIFAGLTVAENLRMARYGAGSNGVGPNIAMDEVVHFFPILGERSRQTAGTLSGGQQQQLAIARALVQRPKLLLLDEPSLGLAPMVVAEVLAVVEQLKMQGIAVILVEQFIREALKIADRAAVIEQGRIVLEGAVADLDSGRIAAAYLGGEAPRAPATATAPGRGTERVTLSLPGRRLRELERAAAVSGQSLDELVGKALERKPARSRPR
jgi:branched-chain amino acid transport system ATP-binding protein